MSAKTNSMRMIDAIHSLCALADTVQQGEDWIEAAATMTTDKLVTQEDAIQLAAKLIRDRVAITRVEVERTLHNASVIAKELDGGAGATGANGIASLHMNETGTMSVTTWNNGTVTVATRNSTDDVWSPPTRLVQA